MCIFSPSHLVANKKAEKSGDFFECLNVTLYDKINVYIYNSLTPYTKMANFWLTKKAK